jgi:hypothetical protein
MPVSSTATTTPAPVRVLVSAPTAVTPQVTLPAAAWSAASAANGSISCVGITGAMARTSWSRLRSRTSARVSSAMSTAGSLGSPAPASSSTPASGLRVER